MCICVCQSVGMCTGIQHPVKVRIKVGNAGDCELPDLGAGSETWILYKSSTGSNH